MKKSSNFSGPSLMTTILLLTAFLGSIYRIPIANILKLDGLLYYQVVFPIVLIMGTFAMSGFSQAVCNLISTRIAKGDRQTINTIFYLALSTFAVIGVVLSVIFWFLAPNITKASGFVSAGAVSIFQWATPLFFVCMVAAAMNGYFQGYGIIMPSVFSQFVGKIITFVVGIILALLWVKESPEKGALGALLGIVIGEIVSLLLMGFMYMVGLDQMQENKVPPIKARIKSRSKVISCILKKAMVLSIGMLSVPVFLAVDTYSGLRLVSSQSGTAIVTAPTQFAIYAGLVLPIALFIEAFVMVFVRSNSAKMTRLVVKKEYPALRKNIEASIRLPFVIGVSIAVCLAILGGSILQLFFPDVLDATQLDLTVRLLIIMSFGTVFCAVGQSCLVTLQNIGREFVAMVIVVFAIIVKIVVLQITVRVGDIGILGLAFSTVVALGVIMIISWAYVIQMVTLPSNWWMFIPKTLVMGGIGGVALYFVQYGLQKTSLESRLIGLICLVLGLLLFIIASFALKLITKDDVRALPFGKGIFPQKQTKKRKRTHTVEKVQYSEEVE